MNDEITTKIKTKKAKNPELDHLHEVASKRLEEMKLAKQTLVDLRHSNKKKTTKRREKVEVVMEEDNVVENDVKQSAALEAN